MIDVAANEEVEVSFSNTRVDLPGVPKQSLFLSFQIGEAFVMSQTQECVASNIVWDKETLCLFIDREHWMDPEASLTVKVQSAQQSTIPNVSPVSLCAKRHRSGKDRFSALQPSR